MYVSGIASATRRAADAHLVGERALLALAQPRAVAVGEELDDLGTDVVLRVRVLVAGVAEPDDEQVGRGSGARRRGASRAAGATRVTPRPRRLRSRRPSRRRPRRPEHPRPRGGLAPSPSSPSASSGTSSSTTRGATTWATSASASIVAATPGGSVSSSRRSWSPISRCRDVGLDPCRDVLGLGLDRQREDRAARGCRRRARRRAHRVRCSGDLGGHGDVGADADEVDVDEVAAGRVALHLAGEREGLVAVDLQRDQRVGATWRGGGVSSRAGTVTDERVGARGRRRRREPCPARRSRPAGRDPRSARGSAVRASRRP